MNATAVRQLRSVAEVLGLLALSLWIFGAALATAVGSMTVVAMLVACIRAPAAGAVLVPAVSMIAAAQLAPSAVCLVALGLLLPRSQSLARLPPLGVRAIAAGVGATYAIAWVFDGSRTIEPAELVSFVILGSIGAITGAGNVALGQRMTPAGLHP